MLDQLKSLTILYVEDDNLTRALTKNALEKMLKKVYIAKDGEEGLRLYQKVSPDIVLTDMYMPKMNGFEMATKIKTLKSTQVIGLFSGDSEEKINTKSDLNPIDIFISKPLNRSEFHKALITLTKLSIN